jgi:hypothetical protein
MASKENWAEAPKGNDKAGEKIFKTKCAQCHAVEKAAGHKQGAFGTGRGRLGLFCLDCTFSYGQLGDPPCELLLLVK